MPNQPMHSDGAATAAPPVMAGRYAQKKTRLFAGIGAVTIAAGVIVALPYARKESQRREGQRIAAEQHDATWRELSWGPDGPSFTVLGFIEVPEPDRNRPVIQLVCRWHTAPSPWDRYEFSFPGAQITYPDGMPAFPMTSPMTENGFVIHYFFIQYPSRMTPLTIPISLKDRKTNTDLGVQLLAFKYWPDKEGLMLALFDKDASTKSPSRRR